MSGIHLSRGELYDWVDGHPGALARQHLAECLECRRRGSEVEQLLDALAGLPREIEPPEWVWDGLLREARAQDPGAPARQASVQDGNGRVRSARSVGWRTLYRLAAALLLAGAGLVGIRAYWNSRDAGRAERVETAAASPFEASLRVYEQTSAALSATFYERAAALPPDTRRALARALGELDRAIAGVRAALVEQPNQPQLQARLSRTYRWKVKILERAVRLTTEL